MRAGTAAVEGVATTHAAVAVAVITTRIHASAGIAASMISGVHIAMTASTVAAADAGTIRASDSAAHAGGRMVYACRRTVHVVTAKASVPYRTTIGIEATLVVETAVSAIIRSPHAGASIEVIAAIVVAIDGEVPAACTPHDRTQEVIGNHQEVVLPVVQDAAEVVQSVAVIAAVEIRRRINTKEVIEVDFVGIVVLLLVEVQLVCHLVRQVESLCLCAVETHCIGTHPGCHHKNCGENKLFHSRIFLCLFDNAFSNSHCKGKAQIDNKSEDFP